MKHTKFPLYWKKHKDRNPDPDLWVHKIIKLKHMDVTLNIMSQEKYFGVSAVLIDPFIAFSALSGEQDGLERDASLRTM